MTKSTEYIQENHADFLRASFMRRLGALGYDALMAAAIFAIAHFIFFGVFSVLANFNPTMCDDSVLIQNCLKEKPYSILNSGFLIAAVCLFFVWFWTHGGQTLGMRAWRLKVQRMNGTSITSFQAILRLATGFFGLGNIWLLSKNSEGMSLQDRISGSEIVVLSPEANKIKNWNQL